jgi:Uma2 family endonuclease
MIPENHRLTFDDYRSWPDDPRWEIIDGHPYAMSSPSSLHQELSTSLVVALTPFFRGRGCRLFHAPMDVKLSDHDVVQPDLLVVCEPKQIRPTHIEGPPTLVVEVLSPSTLRHDRVRKLNLYARVGVPEYWVITPHPFMIEVLRLERGLFSTTGSYTELGILKSPGFPELELDLAELYATLPPQPPIDEVREASPPYSATSKQP